MQDNMIIMNILNKISKENIRIQDLKKQFNDSEFQIIQNMFKDGSITNTLDKSRNEEIVSLTNKGKFTLFTFNHKEEINEFAKKLETMGYDTIYLSDYLKISNLNCDIDKIFLIESYDVFMHNIKLIRNNRNIARRILINNRNIG